VYKILANTLFLGKDLIYMPTCHSTNDIALDLVSKYDKKEGTLVVTDKQLKGRGQRGNEWQSQGGQNLTFSVVLKPNFVRADEQFYLNMMVSLAIYDAIDEVIPEAAKIKWPNDILVEQKKVCGVLIENTLTGQRIGSSVVGIGLNVNQEHFAIAQAASLSKFAGKQLSLTNLLERIILHMEAYYLLLKKGDKATIKDKYCQVLYGFGHSVKLHTEHDFLGVIKDVDSLGRIIVDEDGAKRTFDFKEVKFVLS
jgi:BirA family biotin operon repressor/biotin-[acetyl-CoA-carboxylase] ligase